MNIKQIDNRKKIVTEIARIINQIELPHPVRVAIDGAGNAGKTTFGNELGETLFEHGRTVIRSTIDGFHNPPEIRRRKGKYSPIGYLEDSYDYPQLKRYLLEPLGPNGNLIYKESVYNFRVNQPTYEKTKTASPKSILLFDGIFLFNEHLYTYWDYKLYIDASFENTLQRAIVRDNELFGGSENVIKLYKKRYIPGQKKYLSTHNPISVSDITLNNDNFQNLIVTRISNNKLHKNLLKNFNELKI